MDYKGIKNLNYLESEGTFRFGCDCCGQCCKERGDILLTAYDIMRLQKYLDISFKELLVTYCELYVGNDSGLPIVRLKTDARCPFLFHKKCYVQDAKPAVCALFPLGRIYDGEKVRYFLQKINCGTNAEEHTLREWLEKLGPDSEECCILWGNLLKEGMMFIKQAKEKSSELEEMTVELLASLMYDNYEIGKKPDSQIRNRISLMKDLRERLSEIPTMKKQSLKKKQPEKGCEQMQGGGPYEVSDCPKCGSIMWNGQCENVDCEHHWYLVQDEEEEMGWAIQSGITLKGYINPEQCSTYEYAVFVWNKKKKEYSLMGRPFITEELCRSRYRERVEKGWIPPCYDSQNVLFKRHSITELHSDWEILG